jgi:nitrous oxidase accessory protein
MLPRALIAATGLLLACEPAARAPQRLPAHAAAAAPEGCRVVGADEALGAVLAQAKSGDALCLREGIWSGPIELDGVALYGTPRSIIRTNGRGTTVLMHSHSALYGVTVDGSGGRFDVLDAAVKVNGDDVTVEGVTVVNSVFGILSEKSKRVQVRFNHVRGIGGEALGMRGDGIRLWETNDSVVEGNQVEDARDCVVWYSSNNRVVGNDVRSGRYGLHLMYSHHNRLADNVFVANEVGIFAMYSRDLQIEGNQLLFSRGSAGIGLGMKESGNLNVRRNVMAYDTQGLFLDNSPLTVGDQNVFEDNEVRLSDVGVGFLSSQHDNLFRHNTFKDNTTQVRVDGGGDALGVRWVENTWSDYAGYDLDGDGKGDLPYELKDLSDALSVTHPELAFLRGTPALGLVAVAGEVVPLFAPKPVLHDDHPRMPEARHAN